MPTSAAGSKPTGESTLKRPPTSGGTLSVAIPSRPASSRRAPRSGSVVNTMWREAAAPSASSSHPRTTRYCAIVSAVPPDLLMTLTRTLRGSIRANAAFTLIGSTFSSTVSRGKKSRPSSSSSFQAGRRSALSSALVPEGRAPDAEHQDVIVGLAQAFGKGLDLPHGGGLVDQLVEAVLTGLPPPPHLRLNLRKPGGQLGDSRPRQTPRPVEALLQQATIGQSNHAISTVSPS